MNESLLVSAIQWLIWKLLQRKCSFLWVTGTLKKWLPKDLLILYPPVFCLHELFLINSESATEQFKQVKSPPESPWIKDYSGPTH